MLIQILALIALQHNRSDREHVHIFRGKNIAKKVNLVALAKGYKEHK